VRRHRDRLWAVALRTLGDREEAADAVQDALVSAYRAAHTFRGQSAVTTWLHRITVNACLDRARKAASRKTSPVDDAERLEQLLEPHESASAPAESAPAEPTAACLGTALTRAAARRRVALRRRGVRGAIGEVVDRSSAGNDDDGRDDSVFTHK